jgi:hypothetical protein
VPVGRAEFRLVIGVSIRAGTGTFKLELRSYAFEPNNNWLCRLRHASGDSSSIGSLKVELDSENRALSESG